ncbi:MAG: response regulator [Verrucomicrobiota bacterium]
MKSILFIDDEPFVLNSVKRMMRKERNRWEAHFAVGGEEALEILDKRSFDLVVTDMKMPIVDGIQVLVTCENLYPHMSRIALSGYSEKETQARATRLAHDFLYKPCDSKDLRSALENHLGD